MLVHHVRVGTQRRTPVHVLRRTADEVDHIMIVNDMGPQLGPPPLPAPAYGVL